MLSREREMDKIMAAIAFFPFRPEWIATLTIYLSYPRLPLSHFSLSLNICERTEGKRVLQSVRVRVHVWEIMLAGENRQTGRKMFITVYHLIKIFFKQNITPATTRASVLFLASIINSKLRSLTTVAERVLFTTRTINMGVAKTLLWAPLSSPWNDFYYKILWQNTRKTNIKYVKSKFEL